MRQRLRFFIVVLLLMFAKENFAQKIKSTLENSFTLCDSLPVVHLCNLKLKTQIVLNSLPSNFYFSKLGFICKKEFDKRKITSRPKETVWEKRSRGVICSFSLNNIEDYFESDTYNRMPEFLQIISNTWYDSHINSRTIKIEFPFGFGVYVINKEYKAPISNPVLPGYRPSSKICLSEYEFEKMTNVALRLRLGSLDYTNYLEQKPNAVKPLY